MEKSTKQLLTQEQMKVYHEYKITTKSGKIYIIMKTSDNEIIALSKVDARGDGTYRKIKPLKHAYYMEEPTKADFNLFLKIF